MTKSGQRIAAYAFGVVIVCTVLALAMFVPYPTPFQYVVFRIVLALAVAGVAAMIPGFLSVEVSTWIRASGALAVLVIVYFYNPAQIVAAPPDSKAVNVPTAQTMEQVATMIAAGDQMSIDWSACSVEARRAVVNPGPIRAADGRRLIEALRYRVDSPKYVLSVIQHDDKGVYEVRCN